MSKQIMSFGEALWDCLPRGLFPGGAPMNVAAHLARLGHSVHMITSVGGDFLGWELERRMRGWNIQTDMVFADKEFPTGVVMAKIDDTGRASYHIETDVAWDNIPCTHDMVDMAERCDAFIYGTLAQRSENNLHHVKHLLKTAVHSLRVFDVNLRTPHDDLVLADQLACLASLIKLNDEEASRLSGKSIHDCEAMAKSLSDRWPAASICVTAGPHGAGLLHDGKWFWGNAEKVTVADTVGAGDAFLAALVHGLLEKQPEPIILKRACRLAEFVASQEGPLPDYSETIQSTLNERIDYA